MDEDRFCSCGAKADHWVYATFDFYYCSVCKIEVGPPKPQNAEFVGVFHPALTPGIRYKILDREEDHGRTIRIKIKNNLGDDQWYLVSGVTGEPYFNLI